MASNEIGQTAQKWQTDAEGRVIFKRGSRESFRPFAASFITHFKPNEFNCRCGICTDQIVAIELIQKLQQLRDIVQTPVHITSGYRCLRHQEFLNATKTSAAKNSTHCQGKAADIYVIGLTGVELAKIAAPIFNGIGVSASWIHCDVRDHVATWTYEPLNLEDIKKEIGR